MTVVTLPTAGAAQVVQPARRGRFPSKVVPIRRGREVRQQREDRAREVRKALRLADAYSEHAQDLRVYAVDVQAGRPADDPRRR